MRPPPMLGHAAPPEAVAALRVELGLSDPAWLRYFHWLADIAHGDLGQSLATRQEIAELLPPRLYNTLFLSLYAAALAVPLSLGFVVVLKRDSFIDRAINALARVAISFPEFFVAYPGLGQLMVDAVSNRSMPVALIFASAYVLLRQIWGRRIA